MQYKLLALTIPPTAAASSLLHLRGGPISQASVTASYNHGVSLPPPDKLCLAESRRSACQQALAKDGTGCVWCDVPSNRKDHNGDEGLCLSEFDVTKAMELMSFPCPQYLNGQSTEELQVIVDGDEESKQGTNEPSVDASLALPDFSCFAQAWGGGDKELCNTSSAMDGSSCLWCVADDDLIEVGACLSTSQAGYAKQFGLKCQNVASPTDESREALSEEEITEGLPDSNCFKAAWTADNAESACGQTTANDGSPCVWCQTQGDAMGACLSNFEAGFANGQFGLTCPGREEGERKGQESEDMKESEEEAFIGGKEQLIPA